MARFALSAVAAAALLGLMGEARADTAVVQQDATPIVSAPGVGGRVLTRVDTGFTLTVLGREGAWLQVASPRLQQFGGTLWVPAERVGDIVAAPDDAALADGMPAMTAAPQFRIMSGTEDAADPAPDGSRDSPSITAGARTTAPSQTHNSTARAGTMRSGTAATSVGATAAPDSTQGDATPAPGNATPATQGNATPPGGNATPALGNATPATQGDPTPPGGDATPALGNPTPAPGNPTPPGGNATPATGGTTVGAGTTRSR